MNSAAASAAPTRCRNTAGLHQCRNDPVVSPRSPTSAVPALLPLWSAKIPSDESKSLKIEMLRAFVRKEGHNRLDAAAVDRLIFSG